MFLSHKVPFPFPKRIFFELAVYRYSSVHSSHTEYLRNKFPLFNNFSLLRSILGSFFLVIMIHFTPFHHPKNICLFLNKGKEAYLLLTDKVMETHIKTFCREQLTDVTLSCGGTILNAHSLLLSVCSPYFRWVGRPQIGLAASSSRTPSPVGLFP